MNDQFDHTYCSLTEMRLASTSFSSSCAHLDTIVSAYFSRTMRIRRSSSDQNFLTMPTFTVIVLDKFRWRSDDSAHFWPLNTHVMCTCLCVWHDHEGDGVYGGGEGWSSRVYEKVKSINCLYYDDFVMNTDCVCGYVGVVNGLYIWMNLFLPSVQYFRNIVHKCLYCWQFNWAPTN